MASCQNNVPSTNSQPECGNATPKVEDINILKYIQTDISQCIEDGLSRYTVLFEELLRPNQQHFIKESQLRKYHQSNLEIITKAFDVAYEDIFNEKVATISVDTKIEIQDLLAQAKKELENLINKKFDLYKRKHEMQIDKILKRIKELGDQAEMVYDEVLDQLQHQELDEQQIEQDVIVLHEKGLWKAIESFKQQLQVSQIQMEDFLGYDLHHRLTERFSGIVEDQHRSDDEKLTNSLSPGVNDLNHLESEGFGLPPQKNIGNINQSEKVPALTDLVNSGSQIVQGPHGIDPVLQAGNVAVSADSFTSKTEGVPKLSDDHTAYQDCATLSPLKPILQSATLSKPADADLAVVESPTTASPLSDNVGSRSGEVTKLINANSVQPQGITETETETEKDIFIHIYKTSIKVGIYEQPLTPRHPQISSNSLKMVLSETPEICFHDKTVLIGCQAKPFRSRQNKEVFGNYRFYDIFLLLTTSKKLSKLNVHIDGRMYTLCFHEIIAMYIHLLLSQLERTHSIKIRKVIFQIEYTPTSSVKEKIRESFLIAGFKDIWIVSSTSMQFTGSIPTFHLDYHPNLDIFQRKNCQYGSYVKLTVENQGRWLRHIHSTENPASLGYVFFKVFNILLCFHSDQTSIMYLQLDELCPNKDGHNKSELGEYFFNVSRYKLTYKCEPQNVLSKIVDYVLCEEFQLKIMCFVDTHGIFTLDAECFSPNFALLYNMERLDSCNFHCDCGDYFSSEDCRPASCTRKPSTSEFEKLLKIYGPNNEAASVPK